MDGGNSRFIDGGTSSGHHSTCCELCMALELHIAWHYAMQRQEDMRCKVISSSPKHISRPKQGVSYKVSCMCTLVQAPIQALHI